MRNRNYEEFYNRMTEGIRQSQGGVRILQGTDRVLRYVMEIFYPVFLVWQLFCAGLQETLPYVVIPGAAFVIFSLIRSKIDRKRPYEEWNIEPLIHRDGTGHSMPSRHVFSAAMIAMCALRANPVLGMICLILSAVIAGCRVLGGVHYPEDVIAGYAVGVAAGALLLMM